MITPRPGPPSARPSRIVKSNRMYFVLMIIWATWSVGLAGAYYPLLDQLNEMVDRIVLGFNYGAMIFFLFYALWHYLVILFSPSINEFGRDRGLHETDNILPKRTIEPVAILYTTCDDFDETAAETCLEIDYPNYRLFILDDSKSLQNKERVDLFCQKHTHRTTLVRRNTKDGYKAGNLNYAIEHYLEDYSYILIADADEKLPAGILLQLLKGFDMADNILFVQSGHTCSNANKTPFSRDFHGIINYMWRSYQYYRNKYGLLPSLGHGVLLNLEKLKKIGGFPPIVSEDIALTVKARQFGYVGYFIPNYEAGESFPETYTLYRKRFFRWTIADCECLHRYISPFLFLDGIAFGEKVDIFIRQTRMIASSLILPLLLVNILMSPHLADLLFNRWETHITLLTVAFSPFLCFIIPPPPHQLRQMRTNIRLMVRTLPLYLSFSALPPMAVIKYIFQRKAQFTVTGSNRVSHAGWLPNGSVAMFIDFLLGAALSAWGLYTSDWIMVALVLPLMAVPLFLQIRWGSLLAGSVTLLLPLILFLAVALSLIYGHPAPGMFGLLGLSVILFS